MVKVKVEVLDKVQVLFQVKVDIEVPIWVLKMYESTLTLFCCF